MKTSEMIAMLEKDPTLKFWSPQAPIDSYLYVDRYKRICWGGRQQEGQLFTPTIKESEDWEIVREPVPVWEAIKALKEGQTVTVKWLGFTSVLNPTHNFTMSINTILNGTWYIGGVS